MLVIEGTGQEAPLTPGKVSQYNRVDHNYFHDITNTGGNNWETMRIGRSWQGPTKGFNVIEHNLFERTTGDPETISVKSSANIIRHNTLRATAGEIALRHGNSTQVYGNYILADGEGRLARDAGLRRRPPHLQQLRGRRVHRHLAGRRPCHRHRRARPRALPGLPGLGVQQHGHRPGHPGRGAQRPYPPLDCRVANNIITGGGEAEPRRHQPSSAKATSWAAPTR